MGSLIFKSMSGDIQATVRYVVCSAAGPGPARLLGAIVTVLAASFAGCGVGPASIPDEVASSAFDPIESPALLGAPLTPPPTIRFLDADGVPLSGDLGGPVSLSARVDGADGRHFLVGDTSASVTGGVARFGNVMPGIAWRSWRLVALTVGLDSVTSPPFAVVAEFESVIPGGRVGCGLLSTGRAACWGSNTELQLGNALDRSSVPALANGGRTMAQIAIGGFTTCGVDEAGAGFCWGSNGFGKLGGGSQSPSQAPLTPIVGPGAWASIHPSGAHACGLATDGEAWCWGAGNLVGDGIGDRLAITTPSAVVGSHTFLTLSASPGREGVGGHTCGIATDGATYCWGSGEWGQLGNGSAVTSATPVAVVGGHEFVTISAGNAHTCGLLADGTAYCWGANSTGALGLGSTTGENACNLITPCPEPRPVEGDLRFIAISAGDAHTCGIAMDRSAYCWGRNVGNIGDGTTEDRTAPTPVVGGRSFLTLTAGIGRTCGLASDGLAYCWGDNGTHASLGVGGDPDQVFTRPTVVRGQG